MDYKVAPITVPQDDPFKFDVLNRKPAVEALSGLISQLKSPFVLAIDSPWGTGKTTFVNMLMADLESRKISCLYVSAWDTDFSEDPLVAFVAEFEEMRRERFIANRSLAKSLENLKKLASRMAKRAVPAIGKLATLGMLDTDDVVESVTADFVEQEVKDAIENYAVQKDLMKQFRGAVSESVDALKEAGKEQRLVVFVDEIDRCRPTYSVALLERIKHLFSVENTIFVLALDKKQLGVSLSAVYGAGLDSTEYLRRFIDLEFQLPIAHAASFTSNLISRFGMEEFFQGRSAGELRYEYANFADVFNELSHLFRLSLRAREQCFSRVVVAMVNTPERFYLYPIVLTTLVTLKERNPDLYKDYAYGAASASSVARYIRSIPNGVALMDQHIGLLIEFELILTKLDDNWTSSDMETLKAEQADPGISLPRKERVDLLLKWVGERRQSDKKPSLRYILPKIEIVSQMRI